ETVQTSETSVTNPMNSSETVSEIIRETILTILKSSSMPLTAAELRVQLRVRSLRLVEHKILYALRCLRSEGLVRLERGRWRATAPFASGSVPIPTARQLEEQHRSRTYSAPTSSVLRPTTSTAWSPSKSQVLNDIPQSREQTPPTAEPVDF